MSPLFLRADSHSSRSDEFWNRCVVSLLQNTVPSRDFWFTVVASNKSTPKIQHSSAPPRNGTNAKPELHKLRYSGKRSPIALLPTRSVSRISSRNTYFPFLTDLREGGGRVGVGLVAPLSLGGQRDSCTRIKFWRQPWSQNGLVLSMKDHEGSFF